MNREIKFRVYADNKFYNKCLVGNTNNIDDENWTCPMVWLEKRKEWVHCDNGIICQYTGLHDKNGKEIYEGDIVAICFQKAIKRGKAVIKYIDKFAGFVLTETGDAEHEYAPIGDYQMENFEVIGNIYDNPELLGGE